MAEKKFLYNNSDIELIKSVFAENDELLIAIRKLFFGAEISPEEKKSIVEAFEDDKIVEVFKKKVYGLNNPNTPVGQLSDFWLGVEEQIFGASRDTIIQAVNSKAIVFEMFEKAFKLLKNPDGEKVSIEFNPATIVADELAVNLIARNLYMKAIETSLLAVKSIAGKKDESVEQTLNRLQKDSAK